MRSDQAVLSNFESIRPQYETLQEKTLDWLIDAHVQSKKTLENLSQTSLDEFRKEIESKLLHVACKKEIHKRGHEIPDYLHKEWDKMEIYPLSSKPSGVSLEHRMNYYKNVVNKVFEKFYEKSTPPDDIVHVSCTGYNSPSAGQIICANRHWNTTVTHAYHMGCYASIPGIRIANGFYSASKEPLKYRGDIVHTEVCSLHTNPLLDSPDQLVSQSLFADGYIKYSLTHENSCSKPHLKILSLLEQIIPDSSPFMTWELTSFGFKLFLAKEIPVLIARNLNEYLKNLCAKANVDTSILKNAYFAIHPGGPKILSQIKKILDISDEQIKYSYDILYNYGNMSSATLPHVWKKLLEETSELQSPYVVSLAFGPGLSICGALLKKEI